MKTVTQIMMSDKTWETLTKGFNKKPTTKKSHSALMSYKPTMFVNKDGKIIKNK